MVDPLTIMFYFWYTKATLITWTLLLTADYAAGRSSFDTLKYTAPGILQSLTPPPLQYPLFNCS